MQKHRNNFFDSDLFWLDQPPLLKVNLYIYFKTHSCLPTTINIDGTTLGTNATRKIKLDPLSLQKLEPPPQISPKSKLHHKSVQITIYCSPNNHSPRIIVLKKIKKKKKEERKKAQHVLKIINKLLF